MLSAVSLSFVGIESSSFWPLKSMINFIETGRTKLIGMKTTTTTSFQQTM